MLVFSAPSPGWRADGIPGRFALRTAILLLLAGHGGGLAAGEPVGADEPTVETASGTYQTAWLDLAGGPGPCRIFVALRDGKPVQAWSTRMQLPGGPKPQGSPKLLTDALHGELKNGSGEVSIDFRLASVWAPQSRLGLCSMVLKLSASGQQLTGSWTTAGDGGGAKGTLSGKLLSTAELARRDAIAPGQDWPWFYGLGSTLRAAPYGKPLIGDLAAAKPLWRSETVSLSPWGTGADARYKERAAYGTLCGGAGSPVVADGRVYLFHYRPSGDGQPQGEDVARLEKFKAHPVEHESLRRFFSVRADVVLTCLDAVDGHTLWESTWPGRQQNWQTHKWRGNNPTPFVSQGMVVFADYGWGLYAHDAASGALRWSRGGGGNIVKDNGSVGPLVIGSTVVWATPGGTAGLDLNTGTERWKAPGALSARGIELAGRTHALLVGETLRVVDAATGTELASGPTPTQVRKDGKAYIGRAGGSNLIVEGDTIFCFELVSNEKSPIGRLVAMEVRGKAIEVLWRSEAQGSMEDGHIGIVAGGGKVFTAFQDRGVAVDRATGKTVAEKPELKANSNPIHVGVDDLLLWQPECQHGSQHIQLIDGKTFGLLGTPWDPPHNDSTAYGEMPIANVVVDGRLIIRGMDGLYCYDLRP